MLKASGGRKPPGQASEWPGASQVDQGAYAPRSPGAMLRKYWNIFRVSLIERLAYRGDFLLGTVLRFLPMLTTILLWEAIYAGSGESVIPPLDPSRPDQIHFTRREMIAYLLLIHISRMFSSMP